MNPAKIIGSLTGAVTGLLNSVDNKAASLIKQVFYLIIFILSMIGIYIGYSSGRESAKIKSPPLAEYTKDLFIIDRNLERDEARFGSMLESQQLNEMKYSDRNKIQFPSRDEMKPEKSEGVLEPESSIRMKTGPGTHEGSRIVEGDYGRTGIVNTDVKPLGKEMKPVDPENIMENRRDDAVKSIKEEKEIKEKPEKKSTSSPAPIKKDSGIIE